MADYFDNNPLVNSINKQQQVIDSSNGNELVYFVIGAIVIIGIGIAVNYEYQLRKAQKLNTWSSSPTLINRNILLK